MNKKRVILILLAIAILVLSIIVIQIYRSNSSTYLTVQQSEVISLPASPTPSFQPTDFTASFEITTNGTKRIFTQVMYHHQSPDLYIENPNPSTIHIKKSEATWNDFFKTLPFSLTQSCLVTGTKQTFCSTETKKLRFFLNEVETPNALENKIQANDHLRVTYGD